MIELSVCFCIISVMLSNGAFNSESKGKMHFKTRYETYIKMQVSSCLCGQIWWNTFSLGF